MLPVVLFGLFFLFVIGSMLRGYFRAGSWVGSLLGGRVQREIGEIVVPGKMWTSQALRVLAMESFDGQPFIGLALRFKGPTSGRLDAIKLSRAEVQDLIRLLQDAAGERPDATLGQLERWSAKL